MNSGDEQFSLPPDSALYHVDYSCSVAGGMEWIISRNWLLYVDSNLTVKSKYALPDSLQDVASIHWMRQGYLVIATAKGIYLFDPLSKTFKRWMPGKLPVNNIISTSYDAGSDRLVIGTYAEGIYIVSPGNNNVAHFASQHISAGACVLADSRGMVWIGTRDKGVILYNPASRQYTILAHDDKNPFSLLNNDIRLIFEDDKHNIWIATAEGVSKLNEQTLHMAMYSQAFRVNGRRAEIYDINKGSDNNIYVATCGNGFFRIDNYTGSVQPVGKGEMDGGWSVNVIKDTITMTGYSPVILQYDTKTRRISKNNAMRPFFGQGSNLVLFARMDSYGDRWWSINGGQGLVRQPAGSNRFEHYYRQQQPQPFLQNYFNCFTEDEKGNIWLGVNKSQQFVCWERASKRFIGIDPDRFNWHSPFSGFTGVRSLMADKKGSLWIGTDGTGLIQYNYYTHAVRLYTVEDGLCSNNIASMLMDSKGRLWMGTTKGLSCLMPADHRIINFTAADGIPEDYFSDKAACYDTSRNTLYFAMKYSVFGFNPDTLLKNDQLPLFLYLDEVQVNGIRQYMNTAGVRQFAHNENNLQIGFTAVDLLRSQKPLFAYMLEGVDNNWHYTNDTRTTFYANLAPGTYHFRLRARHNSSNEWQELKQSITIVIRPAWWQTWLFRLLLLCCTCMLVFYIIRLVMHKRLEKQRILLEKQKAIEVERARISAELHDDLGGGLSTIRLMTEMMKMPEYDHPARAEYLANISRKAVELIQTMNEIVWALNVNNDNLPSLLAYIRQFAMKYFEDLPVHCIIDLPENIPAVMVEGTARRHIFLLVKEALHNIVKHAGAREVKIDIQPGEGLHICISDDGKGMQHPLLHPFPGNGLKNMQARARMLGGKMTIQSNPGGTTINFFLLLKPLSHKSVIDG